MNAPLLIRRERPDQPAVLALLDALDAYLASLYAPGDNHILGVEQLLVERVGVLELGCRLHGVSPRRPSERSMASTRLPLMASPLAAR